MLGRHQKLFSIVELRLNPIHSPRMITTIIIIITTMIITKLSSRRKSRFYIITLCKGEGCNLLQHPLKDSNPEPELPA